MTNNKKPTTWIRSWTVVITAVLLSACQSQSRTVSSLYQEGFPGTARWAVLPFVNHTQATDEMTIQLERILMVQLPSAGVEEPSLYPESEVTSASENLAGAHRLQKGRMWAFESGISFAITGAVNNWGRDKEGRARVAVDLEVVDIRTSQQLWTINGSGEGLPGEDSYSVSRKLFSDLLSSLPINQPE